jgi:hypothetical protein
LYPIRSRFVTSQPLGSRYLLDDRIGQGGMGVVWRARDRETGAPYAIKVLRAEYAADPASVARFVRERTALIRFRHPNVVTLHDMIVEGEHLALVMDLVAGGDLDAYRQRSGGVLALGEALALTAQMCDGLAAAHAAGIVHRDLKPANVLLDAGGVRLADFGVARIAGESPATTTGMVIGTAPYLAPEAISGQEPAAAGDVYAAGITLYELLGGTPPFTGQIAAVMHGHLALAPPRPGGLGDRAWELISACLSKDPAARPAAADLARALRDPALLRESAAGRVPSRAGVAAPAGALAAEPPKPPTEDVPRPPAIRPPRHRRAATWIAAAALALVFAGAGGAAAHLAASSTPRATRGAHGSAASVTRRRAAALAGSASPAATSRAATHAASPSAKPKPKPTPTAAASHKPAAPTPKTARTPPPLEPSGPNLVVDGDFSQPTLTAWNNQVWSTALVSDGVNGLNAAQMTATTTAGLSEIVTGLTPGAPYQLTGWISSDGGATWVGVKAYDSSNGYSQERNDAAWTEVTMDFTPGPGHTTAEVFCWRSVPGSGQCSDVSIRALRR